MEHGYNFIYHHHYHHHYKQPNYHRDRCQHFANVNIEENVARKYSNAFNKTHQRWKKLNFKLIFKLIINHLHNNRYLSLLLILIINISINYHNHHVASQATPASPSKYAHFTEQY